MRIRGLDEFIAPLPSIPNGQLEARLALIPGKQPAKVVEIQMSRNQARPTAAGRRGGGRLLLRNPATVSMRVGPLWESEGTS
jgi:hypothetical protein